MIEDLTPMSEEETQPFYADDFFVQPDDPGQDHTLTARGRVLHVTTHRSLPLPDLKMAQEQAVKTKKDLKNNKVTVESVDEEKFIHLILSKLLKSWPFIERGTGKSLPITLANIRNMDGMILVQLSKIAQEYLTGRQVEIDFLENTSDGASSPKALIAQPSPLVPSVSA